MRLAATFRDGINKDEVLARLKTYIDYQLVKENPDVVIAFGGDGTFLDAFKQYGVTPLYIPINFGNLGFYSSITQANMEKINIILKNQKIIEITPLKVELFKDNQIVISDLCVNDATVLNPIHTLMLDVKIDGHIVQHYRGTGICMATAAGSTAYNKSLGGSVFNPTFELFQMTHIAPINNVIYRNIGNSMIFSKNEVIEMYPIDARFDDSLVTIDRYPHKLKGINKLTFSLYHQKVKILVCDDYNFYTRLTKAFIA